VFTLIALVAPPLLAQAPRDAGRRLVVEQRSAWLADGLPRWGEALRDTTIVIVSLGDTVVAKFDWSETDLIVRRGSAGEGWSFQDPDSGGAIRDADEVATLGTPLLAALIAVPAPGSREQWVDTLAVVIPFAPTRESEFSRAAPPDSLTLRVIRRGRTERLAGGRRRAYATLRWSARHQRTVDREMASGSTTRNWVAEGTGEQTLWSPGGGAEVDSFTLALDLKGVERFRPEGGGEQVVRGRSRVSIRARWEIDGDAATAAQWFERARRGVMEVQRPGAQVEDSLFADRLIRRDTLLVDSLLVVRRASASPEERSRIEGLLACGRIGCSSNRLLWIERATSASVRRHYRTGDVYLASSILKDLEYGDDPWVDATAAAALIDLFGTRQRQRRYGLDRSDAFAALVAAAAHVDSVSASGGRALREAGAATDDPDVRNLFLLFAYRADPRSMLPVVRAEADTTPGYGPIVRQYAEGNPDNIGYSWGLDPLSSGFVGRRSGKSFPGFRAPLDVIIRWMPSYWDAGRRREWARAHEPDAIAVLQGRLQEMTDPKQRAKVAFLLLDLGDTTVVPVLRGMIRDPSTGAEIYVPSEYEDLLADSVTGALLADIQRQLIRYARGEVLTGEDGKALEPFIAHNERPDQHYLLRDHLVPELIREVEADGTLTLITESELQAIADREGIAMALYLHPPQRFGSRIEASLGLGARTRPGTICMCGGVSLFGFRVDSERAAHPTGVFQLIQ